MKFAIITGADGGMGMEITRAVAMAGYRIVMACRNPVAAEAKRQMLVRETGNSCIEVKEINLASLASVSSFADGMLERGEALSLLMNNAGMMETKRRVTEDGLERTASVNYVGPYLLTRKLLPLMGEGSRIVNMVSCTYAIGKLDFPDFFLQGRKGGFWRIPVYSNTKLALTLFDRYPFSPSDPDSKTRRCNCYRSVVGRRSGETNWNTKCELSSQEVIREIYAPFSDAAIMGGDRTDCK